MLSLLISLILISTKPLLVNFIAFPTRLNKICLSRFLSDYSYFGIFYPIFNLNPIFFMSAFLCNSLITVWHIFLMFTSSFAIFIILNFILLQSSMLLIWFSRIYAQLLAGCRYSVTYSLCLPIKSIAHSYNPMTPFNGVLSSWVMLATTVHVLLFISLR